MAGYGCRSSVSEFSASFRSLELKVIWANTCAQSGRFFVLPLVLSLSFPPFHLSILISLPLFLQSLSLNLFPLLISFPYPLPPSLYLSITQHFSSSAPSHPVTLCFHLHLPLPHTHTNTHSSLSILPFPCSSFHCLSASFLSPSSSSP